ncbi:MAG: AgmX/PglI C-terminal domain-containing protein [Kofleriaceae bacterium]
MRLVAIPMFVLVPLVACGGKSAADKSLANSTPPPASSSICEDTITPPISAHVSTTDFGLVISEESFLQRAVRAKEPAMRACYQQRLTYRPHLAGKVVIDITVGGDGKAKRIHTKGFDAELDRCLCETLSAVKFETLSGGEVKASYPLYFTAPSM